MIPFQHKGSAAVAADSAARVSDSSQEAATQLACCRSCSGGGARFGLQKSGRSACSAHRVKQLTGIGIVRDDVQTRGMLLRVDSLLAATESRIRPGRRLRSASSLHLRIVAVGLLLPFDSLEKALTV